MSRALADCVSGSWKTVQLKPYNFNAKGALAESGALHPCKLTQNPNVAESVSETLTSTDI